jgi:hypothetical protein
MPGFDGIDDFLKSSSRRLKDAEELMEQPSRDPNRSDASRRHLRGAMYLAGHAVECLVKAYLIEQEDRQSLRDAQVQINSRRQAKGQRLCNIGGSTQGHSIAFLLTLTDLAVRPGYEPNLWGRVANWNPYWRYDPSIPGRTEADEFVQDVRSALDWLLPKIMR